MFEKGEKSLFKGDLKKHHFQWFCCRVQYYIKQTRKVMVLMLYYYVLMALEETSGESLMQGLSQCYHSSDRGD